MLIGQRGSRILLSCKILCLNLGDTKMKNTFATLMACLFVALVAGGCSAPRPVPFQLVDPESRIYRGTIFQNGQRIEATIDGHTFSGFYIRASGAAVSQNIPGRRFWPGDSVTIFSTNSARAHLRAENGQQLNCEFLFEAARAIGECRTPAGEILQLNADGPPTGK